MLGSAGQQAASERAGLLPDQDSSVGSRQERNLLATRRAITSSYAAAMRSVGPVLGLAVGLLVGSAFGALADTVTVTGSLDALTWVIVRRAGATPNRREVSWRRLVAEDPPRWLSDARSDDVMAMREAARFHSQRG